MAQEEHEVVVQVEHPRELPPAWRHCTPVRRCIGRDTVSSGPLLLHLHCHHVPLRHAYASTDMWGCAPRDSPTSIAASLAILYLDPKKRTVDLLFARDAAASAAPVETVGRQHHNGGCGLRRRRWGMLPSTRHWWQQRSGGIAWRRCRGSHGLEVTGSSVARCARSDSPRGGCVGEIMGNVGRIVGGVRGWVTVWNQIKTEVGEVISMGNKSEVGRDVSIAIVGGRTITTFDFPLIIKSRPKR